MIALLEALAVHYGDGASLLASRALFFPEWWSSTKPDSIRTFEWNGFFAVSLIFDSQKCSSDTFFNFLAAYGLSLYLWYLSLILFIMSFDQAFAPQPVRIDVVIHCMLYLLAVVAASILLWAVTE